MSTSPITYVDRAAINRANAEHSTGPRTEEGKQRSSANALRHGLTAASPVLPTEDRAAYDAHRQQFFDEYKPANATESQFVQELVDTSWRLNRIPLLEADALARAAVAAPDAFTMGEEFDVVDQAHRMLATLGLHSGRLSRQFQKTLAQLREMQEERRRLEQGKLQEAAEILIRHQRKGLPWDPADWNPATSNPGASNPAAWNQGPSNPAASNRDDVGFVFSKEQIERHARFLIHQNPERYDPDGRTQTATSRAKTAN